MTDRAPVDDTNAMMYATRRVYLYEDESKDRMRPDSLFMSRKQAQRQNAVKKPDVGSHHHHHAHHAHHHPHLRKKPPTRAGDDDAAWQPVFQAGCHFWQHSVTGECVADDSLKSSPCPFHEAIQPCEWNGDLGHDNDNGGGCAEQEDLEPYPACFHFLEESYTKSSQLQPGTRILFATILRSPDTSGPIAPKSRTNPSIRHLVMRKSER
ncbi:unnamed protein product [Aphanomyces euteiches]